MKDFTIRSIHLDTARTFIPIDELYERVDEFSALDYTHLQLHLSDDQGWRFESKKFSKLTSIGSKRKRLLLSNEFDAKPDTVPYQGFYTQQQLRDLSTYAQGKGISIIPAIDIPGHCSAAIVAYPELSSGIVFPQVPSLRGAPLWKSSASTICYTSEFTRTWVKGIYEELMSVFNLSEYIHLGFDEINKGECKCGECDLHSLTRLLKLGYETVLSKGKKPIVWWAREKNSFNFDSFPELTLQYWGPSALTKENIEVKNPIIYSQYNVLYYDYPGSVGDRLKILEDMGTVIVRPNAIFKRMKNFPVNVVGVGACLWAENLYSKEIREDYMYPRLVDLANVLKGNDLGDFITSMGPWATSSYMTALVKMIRSAELTSEQIILLRDKMNQVSMGKFLTHLDEFYPQIDYKLIPLTKISTSVVNSLMRIGSDDIEIINELYGN